MSIGRPIVVLTPVRNEKWCLEGFLESTSLWADAILISDQSDDDSAKKIIEQFPKAYFFSNPSKLFNERENREKLLSEGRKRFGPSIFVALDADERLSANVLNPEVLETIRTLEPGVAISIPFFNLKSGSDGWIRPLDPICFSDDGRIPNNDHEIHFPRLCFRNFSEVIDLGLYVLHLQYLDMERYASKIRWYQALEICRFDSRSLVNLYRRYRHLDALDASEIIPLDQSLIGNYQSRNVDALQHERAKHYWWTIESDFYYNTLSQRERHVFDALCAPDTRCRSNLRIFDNVVLLYLRRTMRYYKGGRRSARFVMIYALDIIVARFSFHFRGARN